MKRKFVTAFLVGAMVLSVRRISIINSKNPLLLW